MMPIEWVENKSASYPTFHLKINGEKFCTVNYYVDLRTTLGSWRYQQRGCDSVELDADNEAAAKVEALDMVRTELAAKLEAVNAEYAEATGTAICCSCKQRVMADDIAGGDCFTCRQPRL